MGKAKKTKNILVLTYWSYKEGLIQSYTLPYLKIISEFLPATSKIFLFTLEKENLRLGNLEVATEKKSLLKKKINWLPHKYFPFGGKGMLKWAIILPKLWFLILFRKISHIHCFCTPPGMIGYLLKKTTGKRLVLDSYEPHAEAMVENGEWNKEGKAFKLLFKYEKKQTQAADYFVSATEGMKNYAESKYGVTPNPFFVKPACVDLSLFNNEVIKSKGLMEELDLSDKIVGVYAGKFGGIYLDQEVFDLLKVAYEKWGDKFRFLLLTNHSDEEIIDYCNNSGFPFELVIKRFVNHSEVPKYMGLADFALTPVKSIPTKRYCTPIKDGEYWALGLPVIITKEISDDSDIICKNQIGYVLKDLERQEYVNAVETVSKLINQENIRDKIKEIAIKYRSFERASQAYKAIYY